jgi:hypothetical protein
MRSRGIAGIAGLCIALAWPAVGQASEVIGQNGVATDCAADRAHVQVGVATGPDYTPSAPGVITSWSGVASSTPNEAMKLLVLEPNPFGGPTHFITRQKDELRTLALPSQLNTFTGMHIPIEPGQRLGVYVPPLGDGNGPCTFIVGGEMEDELRFTGVPGEPALGQSVDFFGGGPGLTRRLNASAVVEPDCDGDTLGDETQDADTFSCPPGPQATITKGPKEKVKTRKRRAKATFLFDASEPGATFECALDGAPFAACASPYTVKVKKGEHTLQVRATDPGGNVGSPATDDWKVKRKKKKNR